ncbi:bifunctional adenosylcobinamide kinase/adenosylcobinamide-phosphate guanylyltransferase [uncultured Clostridium sp.]|uniref:bifunctional adenosylcobinamide kinase/adenosylcobinamide-phosphate guanylyltransferase n=1 Tax=uncultured Clostridium sp. TaxID=59620 RepID=UPI0025F96613|nr:bifunctional adenosylcobinamide kinase/adenosylcobinamide-phosphate guanylyltransferase [uncultured Clostridium sp.]
MIFIIGGEYQGKLNYALNLTKFDNEDVIDCLDIGGNLKIDEILNDKRPVIYNFNILIRELLKLYDDETVKEKIDRMFEHNKKLVVISNEIGYGIVPIDKFERRYREVTGRICCDVAKKSKEVHRVICSIGTIIKGDKND